MDTKEKILLTSLELFARDGYEAVSVSTIAQKLDMTKGALYKHYTSKRDIFESIVRRMEMKEKESTGLCRIPVGLFETLPECFAGTGMAELCALTLGQFVYWTEDSFASAFRRLISLERYGDRNMDRLYQRYIGTGALAQVQELMGSICSKAGIVEENVEQLALEFYAPVYTLISLYDGGWAGSQMARKLKEHMERFVKRLALMSEKKPLTKAEQSLVPLPPLMRPLFPHASRYRSRRYLSMLSGPSPIVLGEELLQGHHIRRGGRVCDLGCGKGLSSIFLNREYGLQVFAADPWTSPDSLNALFADEGLSPEEVSAVSPEGGHLPFAWESLDAIVSLGSFHQFGGDKRFINEELLPSLRHGAYIYIAMPGMVKDLHDELPRELLLGWNPDQLELLHDIHYWRAVFSSLKSCDLLTISQMDCDTEAWQDWFALDDRYAAADKRAMRAGADKYLNFIKVVLRKR